MMRSSGETAASAPPLLVIWMGSPPCPGTFQICNDPERPEVRYIQRPSADQTGRACSSPSARVRRDGCPPSAPITYVTYLPARPVEAKNAILRPSGDHCGPMTIGPPIDVSRTGFDASLAQIQISGAPDLRDTNAIFAPSGE